MIKIRREQMDALARAQRGPVIAPCGKTQKNWIEIRLLDEDGEPVADERYEVQLPDGNVESGRLDSNGLAGFYSIDPGTCRVSFPDLDGADWKKC